MALPKFLQSYFWDTDFQNLDLKKYGQFILTRILNYGDERAIKWIKRQFSKNEIKKAIVSSRSLDDKSFNFWSLIFGLDKICSKSHLKSDKTKFGHTE
ncbi:MAG: hypothetical protein N2259_03325 [Patescibacteria group bacterium]|nr:hypothetical protein [Patescibacteria group bacterium]